MRKNQKRKMIRANTVIKAREAMINTRANQTKKAVRSYLSN